MIGIGTRSYCPVHSFNVVIEIRALHPIVEHTRHFVQNTTLLFSALIHCCDRNACNQLTLQRSRHCGRDACYNVRAFV